MQGYSDFRSDTITRPTPEMRKAMAEAVVGDDVLGDDPTVQELERLAAEIMGKEAALYMPSGTMGNAIAVKSWTQELDEVIVEARSHIYNMESTHMTFISRVNPRPLPSNRGAMDPQLVEENIKKPSDHHPGHRLFVSRTLITTGAGRLFLWRICSPSAKWQTVTDSGSIWMAHACLMPAWPQAYRYRSMRRQRIL